MKKTNEELLGEGKWLSLKRSTYLDDQGQSFSWEHIARKGSKHAVIILPILEPSQDVLLIRQFRAGANGYVLGIPAGMVEPGATDVGEEALRELLEETGYTGKVVEVGPLLCSFPALSDATVQLVRVTIDESLPENQNPTQRLEPGEIIETLRVPQVQMRQFLVDEAAAGTPVISGLWYLFACRV
jgi:ADP-ribose pyrophosphatase